ncbi:MAG: hypothetical protein QOF95_378 [Pseudonocardiales bacterium]|nr:hypothetical protein [Pseudonocardiales bacterium]
MMSTVHPRDAASTTNSAHARNVTHMWSREEVEVLSRSSRQTLGQQRDSPGQQEPVAGW